MKHINYNKLQEINGWIIDTFPNWTDNIECADMVCRIEQRLIGFYSYTVASPELGSKAYFMQEVCELRNMWGKKTFWQDRSKALRAFEGLSYVYLNTTEDEETVISIMQSTKDEFDRRMAHALFGV